MDTNTAYDILINSGIASEETINIVTNINGYSMETMCDILYAATGFRNFDQLDE